jgi:hypothetical protein
MIFMSIIPNPPKDLGFHIASHLTVLWSIGIPVEPRVVFIGDLTPSPNKHTPMECMGILETHTFISMILAANDINLPIYGPPF